MAKIKGVRTGLLEDGETVYNSAEPADGEPRLPPGNVRASVVFAPAATCNSKLNGANHFSIVGILARLGVADSGWNAVSYLEVALTIPHEVLIAQ